jgi:copper chaperone CopZ
MPEMLSVDGMSCEHCEQSVEDALTAVDGVTAATADHEAGTATVEGDADTAALLNAIDDAGYDASA